MKRVLVALVVAVACDDPAPLPSCSSVCPGPAFCTVTGVCSCTTDAGVRESCQRTSVDAGAP